MAIATSNLSVCFFSNGCCAFYSDMQYSKALKKFKSNDLLPVFSGFGECFALGWAYLPFTFAHHSVSSSSENI